MYNNKTNTYESYLHSCKFNVTKLMVALRRTAKARGADIVGLDATGKTEIKPIAHRAYLTVNGGVDNNTFIDWLDRYSCSSTGLSYCEFIYNDYLYYVQISDSDFYKIMYTKETRGAGYRVYMDELETRAAWAVRFGDPLSDAEAETAAAYLFNDLVSANKSVTVTKRIRRYYNGNKYYYENQPVKNDSPFKNIIDLNCLV